MQANAIYSRVQLVGQLNAKEMNAETLEGNPNVWHRHRLDKKEFDLLNRTYYTAHILSMVEVQAEGDTRLGDLSAVRRYDLRLRHRLRRYLHHYFKDYPAVIRRISVWFFPCGVILFSIEIDDSGNLLNDITKMHRQWKNWNKDFENFRTEALVQVLKPLTELTEEKDPARLTFQNTKMRQYQVVQVDEETLRDDLLYELATHSSIGVVANSDPHAFFKPSDKYFNNIIRENSVSAFSNWKALALNDTFTVLSIDGIYQDSELDKDGDGYRYFEMLYMRCLVQEYYCFSRNNSYREEKELDAMREEHDIELMEKYYFYDDLSYEFLPPLMYQAMAKGLGLEGDRRELTQHVKQALKDRQRKEEEIRNCEREERRSRNDKVVTTVKLFAVVTIVASVSNMIVGIQPCLGKQLWYNILVLVTAIVVALWLLCKTSNKRKK